jgi:hypothetical protein
MNSSIEKNSPKNVVISDTADVSTGYVTIGSAFMNNIRRPMCRPVIARPRDAGAHIDPENVDGRMPA